MKKFFGILSSHSIFVVFLAKFLLSNLKKIVIFFSFFHVDYDHRDYANYVNWFIHLWFSVQPFFCVHYTFRWFLFKTKIEISEANLLTAGRNQYLISYIQPIIHMHILFVITIENVKIIIETDLNWISN